MRSSVRAIPLLLASLLAPAFAAPRALPEGELPADARLGPLKNLDNYFPFTPSESPAAWKTRAEYVRRQLLVSQGLWPMPTRTPLNAVIHGKVDMGDYTIEKVYLESYPGHYVTGNLYRPAGASLNHGANQAEGRPGVLCPHGHWNNGRHLDQGEALAKKQFEAGEEFSLSSGRSPLQARAVHLARLGCVVFFYDMLGNADSVQIAHRPGIRAQMNGAKPGEWGFFSPQAELHAQDMMGLQTYNSICALDFLASLPDVDAKRLGCTGASGGGTQTFILSAIDERVAAAFPAVMVSTAMQGGCTCENAPNLRVNTGNIEFAALIAPRPLGMTAADDWTKDMLTKGYPELQQHFKMLGVPDHVHCTAYLQYGHNYNYPSRQVMYKWFNKHLKLDHEKPEIERDFKFQTPAQLTVWDAEHPKPVGEQVGEFYEKSLLKWIADDRAKQLAELEPKDEAGLTRFKYVVGGGWDIAIGRQVRAKAVEWELKKKTVREGFLEMTGLLHDRAMKEQVPAVFLYPKEKWNKRVVLWIDGNEGKSSLFQGDGKVRPDLQRLLDMGTSICAIDLLYTGEFLKPNEQPPAKQPRLASDGKSPWKQFAGYTYGYNHSLFASRVHDVLTAISLVHNHERTPDAVDIIGINGAGPIVLAARAQAGSLIRRCAADTGGFRFTQINTLDDANFLPAAAAFGDLPALMALSAPGELWIAGEGKTLPAVLTKAFTAAGKKDAVTAFDGKAADVVTQAIEWLGR